MILFGETESLDSINAKLAVWKHHFTILPTTVYFPDGEYAVVWLEKIERKGEWCGDWQSMSLIWDYRLKDGRLGRNIPPR